MVKLSRISFETFNLSRKRIYANAQTGACVNFIHFTVISFVEWHMRRHRHRRPV